MSTETWAVRNKGPRTNKARAAGPWVESRMGCDFSHNYKGRVRKIQYNYFDMDGDEHWRDKTDQFDPETCVVCGFRTTKLIES